MKLTVDPFLQAYLLDAFEIPGARPKAKAIERLQDGFVFGQALIRQALQYF